MGQMVDVLWIARYDYEPGWVLKSHNHDYYQIIYVIDGQGSARLESNSHDLKEDYLILIPPGITHGLAPQGDTVLKTLDTKFRVNEDSLAESLDQLPRLQYDPHYRIRHVLERIRSEGMRQQPWYRSLCNTLMLQALITLCRYPKGVDVTLANQTIKPQVDSVIKSVIDWIQKHFAEDIGLAEIGYAAGYSPDYLSRRFRRETGMTLHTYLMSVRINQAKDYLKYVDRPIKDIASATGFKSIHHFTRAFKEIEGIPPATWRNLESQGIWKNVAISPNFINEDITVTQDGRRPGKY